MAENGTKTCNPRVIMWCVPRSVSTATTKCFSFVDGAEVWLEPYIMAKSAEDVHSMFHKDATFPLEVEGNEAIYRETAENLTLGGDLENYRLELLSPVVLKQEFDTLDADKKFVFIKDMAIGMTPNHYRYLPDRSSGFRHLFLTRNPIKVYRSLRERLLKFLLEADPDKLPEDFQIPDPETFHVVDGIPDVKNGTKYAFKAQHELWSYVRENIESDPVVVDIDDLLNNPSAMLPRLCHALGIPYTDSLLSWDASSDVVLKWKSVCPNVRDAPRYAMWFDNAFKSTCFKESGRKASLDGATPDIEEVVNQEMPYYNEMCGHRLTANDEL